ncbi:MAG: PspC domain-containing protein [Candidatus Saccharimonas sp.]
MKEVTRISLAQLPFNIEVAAKKSLEKYLDAIESSLQADSDMLKEVESRMVELLTERGIQGEKVVTSTDISYIKEHMGDPKEFMSEPSEAGAASKQAKRLMRSEGDEVLGGVCAGLAAYFGIDVVWIRLAFVLLLFATSGFMALVYIVMWIVTPPAKTATDRLQMKGESVTLAALQAESEVLVNKRRNDRIALWLVRIGGGIMAVFAGLGALGAIAAVAQSYLAQDSYKIEGQDWVYVGLMGLAGLLLALLCWLAAYMLFTGHATKRLFISVAVIIALGLVSFTAGSIPMALSVRANQSKQQAEYNKTAMQKSVDVSLLNSAKRIVIDSPIPLTVNYSVSNGTQKPSGTLAYNSRNTNGTPEVKIELKGDTVHVSLVTAHERCLPYTMRCREWYALNIVGPVLESVTAVSGNALLYNTDTQHTLRVYAKTNGRVELQSIGTIHTVDATLASESRLDATQASLTNVSLALEDALSGADMATVGTLAVTAPNACAATYNQGVISLRKAQTISINGVAFDSTKDYPCTTIRMT